MKGDKTMIDINSTYYQNILKEIADYYSFDNDPCDLETALHIALNEQLNKIRRENVHTKENS